MVVSFVILAWNSERHIRDSIDSITSIMRDNSIKDYEVFIVDNGSVDRTVEILKWYAATDGRIKIILLETNKGTTFSRNVALRNVLGDFICVMDSDVIIEKWDVRSSVTFLREHPALIAPKLVYPNRVIQNSVKKFPTLTGKLLKLPKIFFGYDRFAQLDFYKDCCFDSITKVETAISAFWLFNASFRECVGLLDEKIFYSPEDVDYCVRVQKAGYPVYYYPEIECVHFTQQICHKKKISGIAISHFCGLLYYFLKHRYVFSADGLRMKIDSAIEGEAYCQRERGRGASAPTIRTDGE